MGISCVVSALPRARVHPLEGEEGAAFNLGGISYSEKDD